MLRLYILLVLNALPLAAALCTTTNTVYTTVTGKTRTTSSTYPITTVTRYRSTVLVGTPYAGPSPFKYSTPANPETCSLYTGTDIPPPPSSSAASASLQARDADPATCTTVQTTITVEKLCTITQLIYPAPSTARKNSVLTTSVPDFCASPPKDSTGEVPDGNKVFDLGYPYFARTAVECCIYCSEQYKNFVASGFIPSGLDCECLVNTSGDYPGKSNFCPHGIEPYAFKKGKGHALPGACRKPVS